MCISASLEFVPTWPNLMLNCHVTTIYTFELSEGRNSVWRMGITDRRVVGVGGREGRTYVRRQKQDPGYVTSNAKGGSGRVQYSRSACVHVTAIHSFGPSEQRKRGDETKGTEALTGDDVGVRNSAQEQVGREG